MGSRWVGTTLFAVGTLGAGIICSANVAQADFCGAHEDAFDCAARMQTGPPTPGESAFISSVRGHVPGSDQQLLVTARGICNMLNGGGSSSYVQQETAAHLGTDMEGAGQVLGAALYYSCPSVHVAG